ncbi:MAG: hypothetical protein Q7V02_03320, partial [Methylophilus sp.]|nr:hypothetical protein [Methylophilus sp.]
MPKTNKKLSLITIAMPIMASHLLAFSISSSANTSSNTIYQFQFLEGLGGGNTYARDINNNGKVVGYSDTIIQTQHATIWTNFLASDLGALGGANSQANAINDNDWIVGWSENTQGDIRGAQWVHPLTPAFDMGSLNGTGSPNNNLNSFGLTVGNDGTNATIFTSISSRVYLQNEYGTYGNAMAINDKYQVVGAFTDDTKGAYYAGLWGPGYKLTNLGSLGGNGSWAYDINESSQIVGSARRSDDFIHAAIWNDNKIKGLGTLGGDFSSAFGINNLGQVVGMSTELGVFETYATLWDGDSIINLNDYLDNSYTQDGWIL